MLIHLIRGGEHEIHAYAALLQPNSLQTARNGGNVAMREKTDKLELSSMELSKKSVPLSVCMRFFFRFRPNKLRICQTHILRAIMCWVSGLEQNAVDALEKAHFHGIDSHFFSYSMQIAAMKKQFCHASIHGAA